MIGVVPVYGGYTGLARGYEGLARVRWVSKGYGGLERVMKY